MCGATGFFQRSIIVEQAAHVTQEMVARLKNRFTKIEIERILRSAGPERIKF